MISLKTTTMIIGSVLLSVILVITLFISSKTNPEPATAATITPIKQETTVAIDKKYTPLTGDQYVAYLKAEEERKAAEEAARVAAEQEAARKAEEEKKNKEAAERSRISTSSSSSSAYSSGSSNSDTSNSSNSGSTYSPPAGTPEPGSAKAYAAQQVANRGWGTDQYNCLVSLWQKESGWNQYALNKGSGAYGIPQSLPGNKMSSAGADWETNYETQINWGLGYISDRYGTPCSAWGHSQSTDWY